MDLSFRGAAKRLDDIDLPKLGHRLGVGEDEIHAFLDVETRGYGFDDQGRPLILFEPHVFYRNLAGDKRATAVREGLAYKNWGTKPYPKDSYPRLRAACAIDEAAALKAASWGLGQVLGENFKAAGHATVQDFVRAMMADEEYQLEASVNFILANKLDDELRRHDWAGFAKGYNGAGYKRNRYDTKLAEAFRKWSRIKDTPWKPGDIDNAMREIMADEPKPMAPIRPKPPEPIVVVQPEPEIKPSEPIPALKPSGWGVLFSAILSIFKR